LFAKPPLCRIERQAARPTIEAGVDAYLVRIAVINLLGNAVKFAPDDSVVTVMVAAAVGEASIAISDRGPGIDPADAERLFEPWQRGAGSETPGLGLGLYIVRQIADLHGGRVTVDSTPGSGAVFTLTLLV
jgi:signal transduction histidine kinase